MLKRLLPLSLLLALPALALEPYLVKDINPVPEPGSSFPVAFATLDGAALFTAYDELSGQELWRSDGTAAGTWQVADLCPLEACSGHPRDFSVTDRLLFFTAHPEHGNRRTLWVTDGTPAGTANLDVVVEGTPLWVPAQGVLYFSGSDGEHGFELWRTDGTPAGTHMISDLLTGGAGAAPRSLTLFQGRIWFGGLGPNGGALWRSDGTAQGTALVKELGRTAAAQRNLRPFHLHVLGNRLVFAADAGLGRQDLWASDGTAKGTARLTQWTRGTTYSEVFYFVAQGSRSYIVADDGRNGQELWVTDGTAKGTRALTRFPRAAAFYTDPFFDPSMLLLPNRTGGRFVFGAHDGPHGLELWSTDGTAKGTRLLKDVCPGECHGLLNIRMAHRGRLHFGGDDGVHGWESWVTDGTAAGTRLLRDLCPGSCDSLTVGSVPVVLGDRLLFGASVDGYQSTGLWVTDGTEAGTARVSDVTLWFPYRFGAVPGGKLLFGGGDAAHGVELWITDGTAAGTTLLEDIHDLDLGGSDPVSLRALGDLALFLADDGIHGLELWKSDGTEAGTALVADLVPGEAPTGQHGMGASDVAGGKLFFTQNQQVWRTDGTEAGTLALTGAHVSICCSRQIRAVGDKVFFPLYDGEYRVWVSDGTVEGTHPVGDTGDGPVQELVAFQDRLYFTVRGEDSWELWRSDGTDAGTVLVEDLGILLAPPHLTVHAGSLWYFADDGENGAELRRGNGTGAGTVLVADLAAGPSSFEPGFVVSLGSKLIFSDDDDLWSTDGTPAGTQLLGPAQTELHQISTVFQGRLYYHAYEGGVTLWVTDGTPGGTRRLKDAAEPRPAYDFAPLGDRLLFTAEDDWLWQTDGTGAGTVRLLELGRGAGRDLVRAGSRVFFPAFDSATGVELWAVE